MTSDYTLRTDPGPFRAVWRGEKTAEFRKDDRQFQVGDIVNLIEFDRALGRCLYPIRQLYIRITHYQGAGYGIPEGYAMLSFKVVWRRVHQPRSCRKCGEEKP